MTIKILMKDLKNDYLIECSHKSVKFSIDNLLAEIKHVVMEKDEFEYKDELLLVAISGVSGFSRFSCRDQNQWLFNRLLLC